MWQNFSLSSLPKISVSVTLSIGLEPAPELLEGSKDRPFFHTNAPTTARGQ
jgi:hypothetical protein